MNIEKIGLSHISIDLLHKFYNQIAQSNRLFESLQDADFEIYSIDKREPLYKGKYHDYIPESIRGIIDKEIPLYQKYSVKFSLREQDNNNRIIQLFIYYPSSLGMEFLYEIIQKVYIWFSIVSSYSITNCLKDLNIYLYLLDLPKKFPQKKMEPIKDIHANTAFTTSCKVDDNNTTAIYLFRLEEWFKVLIHESFHTLGLDFSSSQYKWENQVFENDLHGIFPAITTEFRGYESYCEIWASIFNILLLDFLNNVRDNGWSRSLPRIMKKIHNERLHTLLQCSRILQHYNIKYPDLFSSNQGNKNYKEDTNVFSYFILKNVLLYHLNDFLEWMVKTNKGSLRFEIINLPSFFLLIKSHYHTDKLLSDYSKMENEKLSRQSLRMTDTV
jgi:hypothetical protein